uniref:UDP-N-acetylglucosamine transferase subunit ALG13 n=1 Tax=Equus asinus TaxID=9793 RepID=A0A9L0IKV6_EQUAS
MKCVFVTVGTTSFDDLIACVSAHDTLQVIKSLGYNRLVLQIGRGKVVPEPFSTESFTLDVYRYKDSLKEDLQKADLVISHAENHPHLIRMPVFSEEPLGSIAVLIAECRKLFGDSGKKKATCSGYQRKVDEQSSAGIGKAAA